MYERKKNEIKLEALLIKCCMCQTRLAKSWLWREKERMEKRQRIHSICLHRYLCMFGPFFFMCFHSPELSILCILLPNSFPHDLITCPIFQPFMFSFIYTDFPFFTVKKNKRILFLLIRQKISRHNLTFESKWKKERERSKHSVSIDC